MCTPTSPVPHFPIAAPESASSKSLASFGSMVNVHNVAENLRVGQSLLPESCPIFLLAAFSTLTGYFIGQVETRQGWHSSPHCSHPARPKMSTTSPSGFLRLFRPFGDAGRPLCRRFFSTLQFLFRDKKYRWQASCLQ